MFLRHLEVKSDLHWTLQYVLIFWILQVAYNINFCLKTSSLIYSKLLLRNSVAPASLTMTQLQGPEEGNTATLKWIF